MRTIMRMKKCMKILWNMKIQTDKKIDHPRPDIVVFEERKRKYLLINVTRPLRHKNGRKGKGEKEKYQDLKRKVKRI